ncbi:LysR substrate-binding domain-containing protein [Jonesiaceae bacterium BS-20]|uniref:LysR substrate-binding domain-containing protein n=1 Tax=Jonesiaceae bacterium BS-20 TaxID=3120821 RepID=A0AAU7DW57_9MICO
MTEYLIDLRQLEIIRALDQFGSLSAVARHLGYSQPAISQQVQTLEARLKTPVVIRGRRGVELTEAGQVILRHSTAILDTLALAQEEVSAVAGLRSGLVRIVAFPSASATIVAATMADMTRLHPGVSFTLTEAEPPKALELLESGQCDIAVVFRYGTDEILPSESFESFHLLDAEMRVAVPVSHPKANADFVALDDLWDSRWIAGCPDCSGHLVTACLQSGFTPDIAFETDDYVTLQTLAAHGLGVALLSDLALAAVSVKGLLVKALTKSDTQRVCALTTPGLSRVPAVQQTLKIMRQAASSLAKDRDEKAKSS